ncbi:MAG: DNA repair protein RadA [Acidobacteriota bacterium]
MKLDSNYVCQSCGYVSTKWLGKCPNCSSWNSFLIETSDRAGEIISSPSEPVLLSEIPSNTMERIKTDINEFDRCLGGGIVRGSIVLIGGEPGIGKSTLALQISNLLDNLGFKVIYVSGEESQAQIRIRGERLEIKPRNLFILCETLWENIKNKIKEVKPDFLIFDSIQTIYSKNISSLPGTISQVREVTGKIFYLSKTENITSFLIGHITKDGSLAGPKSLEHLVDVVLYFEGEKYQNSRILRAAKNRFGPVSEIGLFNMEEKGLVPVQNLSEFFIQYKEERESGVAVFCALEGSRPLLLEIQALVTPSPYLGNPRRITLGLDYLRTSMIIAIIEKRMGLSFSGEDIFVNVAGGINIEEPSSDLALVSALISSKKNKPISPHTVFFGEIGLGGEVRPVRNSVARIKEAKSLGFKKIIFPHSNVSKDRIDGVEIHGIKKIKELINYI